MAPRSHSIEVFGAQSGIPNVITLCAQILIKVTLRHFQRDRSALLSIEKYSGRNMETATEAGYVITIQLAFTGENK